MFRVKNYWSLENILASFTSIQEPSGSICLLNGIDLRNRKKRGWGDSWTIFSKVGICSLLLECLVPMRNYRDWDHTISLVPSLPLTTQEGVRKNPLPLHWPREESPCHSSNILSVAQTITESFLGTPIAQHGLKAVMWPLPFHIMFYTFSVWTAVVFGLNPLTSSAPKESVVTTFEQHWVHATDHILDWEFLSARTRLPQGGYITSILKFTVWSASTTMTSGFK